MSRPLAAICALALLAGCSDTPDQGEVKEALESAGYEIAFRDLEPHGSADWILEGRVRGRPGMQMLLFVWPSAGAENFPPPVLRRNRASRLDLSYLGIEGIVYASQDSFRRRDPRRRWSMELEDALCRELTGEECGV